MRNKRNLQALDWRGFNIGGGVVNRLGYRLDGDYRRNDDKYNPYKPLERFHENFSLFPDWVQLNPTRKWI